MGKEGRKRRRKETQRKRDIGPRPAATSLTQRRGANGSAVTSPRLKSPKAPPRAAALGSLTPVQAPPLAPVQAPPPGPRLPPASLPAHKSRRIGACPVSYGRCSSREAAGASVGALCGDPDRELLLVLRGIQAARVGPGPGWGSRLACLHPGPAGISCGSWAKLLLPWRAGYGCRDRRIEVGLGLGSGPLSLRLGKAASGQALPLRLRPVRGWVSPGLQARSGCGGREPVPCRCHARQEDDASPEQPLDHGWQREGHRDRPYRPRDPMGIAARSAPPPAPRGAPWRTRRRPAAPPARAVRIIKSNAEK
ncbi:uncharacterized protein LOC143693778 [Agelaius phoeniceus]|uniref:uncharacterized protein LOC143693778 n=1 Tax=Agelaius phoeniceus TaxID=39638 RepID=UPI004054C1C3